MKELSRDGRQWMGHFSINCEDRWLERRVRYSECHLIRARFKARTEVTNESSRKPHHWPWKETNLIFAKVEGDLWQNTVEEGGGWKYRMQSHDLFIMGSWDLAKVIYYSLAVLFPLVLAGFWPNFRWEKIQRGRRRQSLKGLQQSSVWHSRRMIPTALYFLHWWH